MKFKLAKLLLSCSLFAGYANAEMVDISITNLTAGIHFTPVLIAAHDANTHLYQVGGMATDALATMAEGGNISGLSSAVTTAGGSVIENPASGMMAPASSIMSMDFDTGNAQYLSIVAMLLPTNDGFVGLDSWKIPSTPGTYTIDLNGYDAGSEVNDEIINGGGALGTAGIPMDPGANNGTNATGVTTTEPNEYIHVHRGNLGDTIADGGSSDLDSRIHRWLNPVARVVVTVK